MFYSVLLLDSTNPLHRMLSGSPLLDQRSVHLGRWSTQLDIHTSTKYTCIGTWLLMSSYCRVVLSLPPILCNNQWWQWCTCCRFALLVAWMAWQSPTPISEMISRVVPVGEASVSVLLVGPSFDTNHIPSHTRPNPSVLLATIDHCVVSSLL